MSGSAGKDKRPGRGEKRSKAGRTYTRESARKNKQSEAVPDGHAGPREGHATSPDDHVDPTPKREPLSDIDRVIHEPARLMICALLAGVDQADFLFLQRETGLTKGNLSSHLSTLEKSEYVEIEKTYAGKRPLTLVKLTDAGHRAFTEYKNQISAFLGGNSE